MKKLLLLLTAGLVYILAVPAFADCEDDGDYYGNCSSNSSGSGLGVAAGGAALGTASGIYSWKQYHSAHALENSGTVSLFDHEINGTVDASSVENFTKTAKARDRVTIHYQLSDRDNRAYYIKQLQADERGANIATGIDAGAAVIDFADHSNGAAAVSGLLAVAAHDKAKNDESKIAAARAGGAVPIEIFDEVIEGHEDTANAANVFVRAKLAQKGTILGIERLPADQLTAMKKLITKGRVGLAGLSAGALVTAGSLAISAADAAVEKSMSHAPYSPPIATDAPGVTP